MQSNCCTLNIQHNIPLPKIYGKTMMVIVLYFVNSNHTIFHILIFLKSGCTFQSTSPGYYKWQYFVCLFLLVVGKIIVHLIIENILD